MTEVNLFSEFSKEDGHWMREVLKLAEKGRGQVSPNPMVAALIVKQGEIVGKGFHARYGGPHAEAIALADARGKTDGAILYVNLEPCVHFGRTPPCAEQIVKARIRRAVIATEDPDRLVNGRGIEYLRRAHLKVDLEARNDPRWKTRNTLRSFTVDNRRPGAELFTQAQGRVGRRDGGCGYHS